MVIILLFKKNSQQALKQEFVVYEILTKYCCCSLKGVN